MGLAAAADIVNATMMQPKMEPDLNFIDKWRENSLSVSIQAPIQREG
jgi:hypothetical protein